MSLTQMSFTGGVMILAIIVVRALAIHKLPKKVFVILWEVALLRLLIPFSIPSIWSAYSLISRSEPIQETLADISAANVIVQAIAGPVPMNPETVLPVQHEVGVSVWLLLWMVGTLLCGVFFTVSYVRCYVEFRMALPVDNDFAAKWLAEHPLRRGIQIRQSDRISTPLTYGIFRPVILVPKKTDWENHQQLQYVLMHEYIHICRFDMVLKLMAILALCIHWFNPLVWVMYVLFNRDIELSCDESVVHRFGESFKSTYARTLIAMEEKRSGLTPLYNSFSRNAIEERITAIMKTKKITIGILIISAVVIVAIVVLFATSAFTEQNTALPDQMVEESEESEASIEVPEEGQEGIIGDVEETGTALEMAKEVVGQKYADRKADIYCNWMIDRLEHVYTYEELEGCKVTVYQLNYKFLALDPEKVVLSGGMTMDDAGWVVPEYPNSTYLALVADGGALSYFVITENDCFPGDEVFTEDLRRLLNNNPGKAEAQQ